MIHVEHVEYTQIERPFSIAYQSYKVFKVSSKTPNSNTVSKKWHYEAIEEAIKIRYTIKQLVML